MAENSKDSAKIHYLSNQSISLPNPSIKDAASNIAFNAKLLKEKLKRLR